MSEQWDESWLAMKGRPLAELLGINLTVAAFHEEGIFPSIMTLLKKSRSAQWRDEHFFRMEYEIRSSGEREIGAT